ncbi:MAG: rplF [Gammaproteobacteria bacterium]|jgi:large subunit ribosomal protein L6|nr:rplF [Gammaproteobacteria bacterium]
MRSASRVARKPIIIPRGVDVKIQDQMIAIKGPKGHLTLPIHPYVQVELAENNIKVTSHASGGYCRKGSGSKLLNAMPGTLRSKINSAVLGVSTGFEKKLSLVGVGYRAQMKGKVLTLSVGSSHPVEVTAPEGITIETPSPTEIVVKGADKHQVGHIALKIRRKRLPEPYKGKGIRYADEVIILKETKKK